MKKKLISVLFVVSIILNFNISFAREMSTYDNLVSIDDPFIPKIKEGGATDTQLKAFLNELDTKVDSFKEDIYMSDTDLYFITMLLQTMEKEEHIPILISFDLTHQDEILYMLNNKTVPDSMYNFKMILFADKVLIDSSSPDETENNNNNKPATPEFKPKPLPFSDIVKIPWCVDSVVNLYDKKIIIGMENGMFEPEKPITREEFLKMVVLSLLDVSDEYGKNYDSSLKDEWFFPYLASADYYSLIHGIYDEDYFKSEVCITRQDMTTIAYRAALKAGIELPNKKYSTDFYDIGDISYYATEPIKELQEADIIHGKGNNRFAPYDTTTRAEAAVIIDSILKLK